MGVKGEHLRLGLFALSSLAIIIGVGLSFGPGLALIVAGLIGTAMAVAWAYVAVTSA
jgi:hypothetical protein